MLANTARDFKRPTDKPLINENNKKEFRVAFFVDKRGKVAVKVTNCVIQCYSVKTNSVITNPWLQRIIFSVPIGYFTTQINSVITKPGYNELFQTVPSCSL